MSVKSYPKGSKEKVSNDFLAREFDCCCAFSECKETLISEELATLLQSMRDEIGTIRINNGYRCKAYQDDLTKRGYETATHSMHLLGEAADISTYKHKGRDLEEAARAAGFKAVGVAEAWIHVDTRLEKERKWGYFKKR